MEIRIMKGGRSNPVTISIIPALAPENARIWLKIIEPVIIMNIIDVILSVPRIQAFMIPKFIWPYAIAIKMVPSDPNAAASDGVAMPRKIRPITKKIIRPIGNM